MKKYEVLEMWDGGDGYYFNTIEEAKAKAKDITEEPKWTAWELEQYKKRVKTTFQFLKLILTMTATNMHARKLNLL